MILAMMGRSCVDGRISEMYDSSEILWLRNRLLRMIGPTEVILPKEDEYLSSTAPYTDAV